MNSIYPWQTVLWRQVQDRISAGRLAHGLLLTGPGGLGKRVFANALAEGLLCRRPNADKQACSECEACLLIQAGTHPDLLDLSPAEDKTQIVIDQVRELCRALALKSHAGGYKIATVAPAEQMNTAAANSLLKTLEEPTDNTLLILITEQPARLPATIRSRCQQVRFTAPSTEAGADWLSTCHGVADPELLLRLADGAPLRALALAQDDTLVQRRRWIEDLVKLQRGRLDPIQLAADWSSDAQLRPLYWMGSYLTDSIRLSAGNVESIKNIDLSDILQVLADNISTRELHQLLDQCWQNLRLGLQSSVNRQLLLEGFLIQWSRVGQRRRA